LVSRSLYATFVLAQLLVKVSRPGDNEGAFPVFEVKLPPVTTSPLPKHTIIEFAVFFSTPFL